MSSRQEREVAMLNTMLTALTHLVWRTRQFVATQYANGDGEVDAIATLKVELAALERLPWAKALLDDYAARRAGVPVPDGVATGSGGGTPAV